MTEPCTVLARGVQLRSTRKWFTGMERAKRWTSLDIHLDEEGRKLARCTRALLGSTSGIAAPHRRTGTTLKGAKSRS
jgi:hypothetical protein